MATHRFRIWPQKTSSNLQQLQMRGGGLAGLGMRFATKNMKRWTNLEAFHSSVKALAVVLLSRSDVDISTFCEALGSGRRRSKNIDGLIGVKVKLRAEHSS